MPDAESPATPQDAVVDSEQEPRIVPTRIESRESQAGREMVESIRRTIPKPLYDRLRDEMGIR